MSFRRPVQVLGLISRINRRYHFRAQCVNARPVKVKPLNNLVMLNNYSTPANVKNGLSDVQLKKAIDDISNKFSEAMASMDDAKSSVGTVYFSEDVQDAEDTVQETLGDYEVLCEKLNEEQQAKVNNTIGLKMKELRAQLVMLQDLAKS